MAPKKEAEKPEVETTDAPEPVEDLAARRDMNDPHLSGQEVVERALGYRQPAESEAK
ncbi:hypothetical protein ACETRX_02805 [Labrys portucalensis]|uniref:Uncharacterized protein n=1 Tax=Labrys neptuniae TaxID=376174 RepID=A0ABV6Z8K6_9HYPH